MSYDMAECTCAECGKNFYDDPYRPTFGRCERCWLALDRASRRRIEKDAMRGWNKRVPGAAANDEGGK